VPHVRLRVNGTPDTEVALWEWLRTDPQLRGQTTRVPAPAPVEAMGAATEIVVALASTGTLAAVARTVEVWLTQRHSDVTVTAILPDGRQMTLDARRVPVGDLEKLLNTTNDHERETTDVPPPAAH